MCPRAPQPSGRAVHGQRVSAVRNSLSSCGACTGACTGAMSEAIVAVWSSMGAVPHVSCYLQPCVRSRHSCLLAAACGRASSSRTTAGQLPCPAQMIRRWDGCWLGQLPQRAVDFSGIGQGVGPNTVSCMEQTLHGTAGLLVGTLFSSLCRRQLCCTAFYGARLAKVKAQLAVGGIMVLASVKLQMYVALCEGLQSAKPHRTGYPQNRSQDVRMLNPIWGQPRQVLQHRRRLRWFHCRLPAP